MKAMIFAAGLGTRLRPLTNEKPKALVEVAGKTLLQHVIERLKAAGVKEVVINVHHFAEKVKKHLADHKNFGLTIHISEEQDLLLDTGGGLKKARKYLDDGKPFIVHNTDIISNIDLAKFYEYSLKNKVLANLAVRDRETSRYLLFDKINKQLVGWKNIKTNEVKMSRDCPNTTTAAFSGISVLHPDIFNFMPKKKVFSIIPVLLSAAKRERIAAYYHDKDFWLDVGKKPALAQAEEFFKPNIIK